MPLGPSDRISSTEMQVVDEAISLIDATIMGTHNESLKVEAQIDGLKLSDGAKIALRSKYIKAGWKKIEFNSEAPFTVTLTAN